MSDDDNGNDGELSEIQKFTDALNGISACIKDAVAACPGACEEASVSPRLQRSIEYSLAGLRYAEAGLHDACVNHLEVTNQDSLNPVTTSGGGGKTPPPPPPPNEDPP